MLFYVGVFLLAFVGIITLIPLATLGNSTSSGRKIRAGLFVLFLCAMVYSGGKLLWWDDTASAEHLAQMLDASSDQECLLFHLKEAVAKGPLTKEKISYADRTCSAGSMKNGKPARLQQLEVLENYTRK